MRESSPLREKSYRFAIDVVLFCKWLMQKREYVLSKQLLKSGTSIGANIEEAQQAQSRNDFISKISIALKEANETRYWLRLIVDTGFATSERITPLVTQIQELLAMLTSCIKTTKSRS